MVSIQERTVSFRCSNLGGVHSERNGSGRPSPFAVQIMVETAVKELRLCLKKKTVELIMASQCHRSW